MNLSNIYSKVTTGALTALAPAIVNSNVQLLSPLTHKVHQYAIKALNETQARQRLTLLYLAKPVDRLVQAVAAPVFRQAEYWVDAYKAYKDNRYGWLAFKVIASPLMVPIELVIGLIESVGLIANGALQAVLPYQTVYAVIKGKEASNEYFDYRKTLIQRMHNNFLNINDKIYLPVLSEVENVPPPKVSYTDLLLRLKKREDIALVINSVAIEFFPGPLSLALTAANIVYHNAQHLLFRMVSVA